MLLSRSPRPARVFQILCLGSLLLPLAARADEPVVNWPIATPPPGTSSAIFPVPRNEWMSHFQGDLDRARRDGADLVFDGDSITDGWRSTGKKVWDQNYVPLHAADFGIGGDRTEQVLWRLEKGQAAGLHPKLIALMIGTNNIYGNTDEQIAEAVTAIVRKYQGLCPEAVILLQAILPRSEKPTDPVRAKIKGINATLAKLADGKKIVYVDFGDKFLRPDGTIPADLMPDFLHPSAKGYEVWADAIRPEIEKVFGPTPPAK